MNEAIMQKLVEQKLTDAYSLLFSSEFDIDKLSEHITYMEEVAEMLERRAMTDLKAQFLEQIEVLWKEVAHQVPDLV